MHCEVIPEQQDAAVASTLGLLALCLGFVFYTSNSDNRWCRAFYR